MAKAKPDEPHLNAVRDDLVSRTTRKPSRKLIIGSAAGLVSGCLTTIIAWVAELHHMDLPPEVVAATSTLIGIVTTLVTAYITREFRSDI